MSFVHATPAAPVASRPSRRCGPRIRVVAVASACPSPLERLARVRRASRFYDGPALKRILQPWVPSPSFPRDEATEKKRGGGRQLPVFDAADPATPRRFVEQWGTIDDWVVNGCSVSSVQLRRVKGAGVVLDWHGTLNAASGLGWASARTRDASPSYDFTPYDGLLLRVCGDGQRYKVAVRSEQGLMAQTWEASFDTVRDEWLTVSLPWSAFVPFGWHLPRSQSLRLDHIYGIQLLVSSFDLPSPSWWSQFSSGSGGEDAESDTDSDAIHVRAPHQRYDAVSHHHGTASGWHYAPRNPLFGEGNFQLFVQHIKAYKGGRPDGGGDDAAEHSTAAAPAPPAQPLALVPVQPAEVALAAKASAPGTPHPSSDLEAQFKSQWAAEEDRLADAEGLSHVE